MPNQTRAASLGETFARHDQDQEEPEPEPEAAGKAQPVPARSLPGIALIVLNTLT